MLGILRLHGRGDSEQLLNVAECPLVLDHRAKPHVQGNITPVCGLVREVGDRAVWLGLPELVGYQTQLMDGMGSGRDLT